MASPQEMFLAIHRGNLAEVRQLLDAGYPADQPVVHPKGSSAKEPDPTPLAFALFWGHREAAEKLAEIAVVPRNLRVAAGLGRTDILADLFDSGGKLKPEAGFHREFHRPHSGFPPWRPRDDSQEILDEALSYAARSGRIEAMAFLHVHGADCD